MTSPSKHLSERIDRPADEVYDYASDPANLPEWAPGLGSSVEQVKGRWFVETSMGRVGVDPEGVRDACDAQSDAIRASVASNESPRRKMGLAEMLDLND
jgi:polyketide cyclase/dehydrase/lipid transport protein